jgi:hypothetical protein
MCSVTSVSTVRVFKVSAFADLGFVYLGSELGGFGFELVKVSILSCRGAVVWCWYDNTIKIDFVA